MKTKILSLLVLLALGFSSCTKDEVKYSSASFTVAFTNSTEGIEVTSGTYTFTNASTGEVTDFAYDEAEITVAEGLYNITFVGEGYYLTDGVDYQTVVTLQGSATNVTITGSNYVIDFSIIVYEPDLEGNFVIKELFMPGTYTPSNTVYNGDQYFIIHNNSNKVLYADGLLFIEGAFATPTAYDYSPLVTSEAVAVNMVLMMPGGGEDYPIAPGESFVIADNAINHLEANANSCDLTGALFEYHSDLSTTSVDNPDVPNCDNVLLASGTFWIANKQGNRGYVLGRLPEGMTTEEYIDEAYYEFTWTFNNVEYPKTGYKFANEYVIDGVQLCPSLSALAWNVLDQTIDLSYTSIGETTTTSANAGKAVIRKTDDALTASEGRLVLVDTNNSANDFNASVTASLLEQ